MACGACATGAEWRNASAVVCRGRRGPARSTRRRRSRPSPAPRARRPAGGGAARGCRPEARAGTARPVVGRRQLGDFQGGRRVAQRLAVEPQRRQRARTGAYAGELLEGLARQRSGRRPVRRTAASGWSRAGATSARQEQEVAPEYGLRRRAAGSRGWSVRPAWRAPICRARGSAARPRARLARPYPRRAAGRRRRRRRPPRPPARRAARLVGSRGGWARARGEGLAERGRGRWSAASSAAWARSGRRHAAAARRGARITRAAIRSGGASGRAAASSSPALRSSSSACGEAPGAAPPPS